MARTYDTRPNLEGYDALTVRGLAKFAAFLAFAFGAQFLANHYGLGRWLKAAVLSVEIAIGLKVMWIGAKALMAGEMPPNAIEGPRYAEPDSIDFVSPRAAAFGEIIGGAILIADTVYKLTQIFSE